MKNALQIKAFSYCRYSSANQNESSIERQLERARKASDENGWMLIDLPPDKEISAWKGLNRITGALGLFIKKVKNDEIAKGSVLIIEKLDRFGRDEVDIVYHEFCNLIRAGIDIFCCVDSKLYTSKSLKDKTDILTAVLGFMMANEYSEGSSDRIKKQIGINVQKALKGEVVKFGGWQPRWITVKDGKFAFTAHAETMKRMVREYLAGDSMYDICKGFIKDKIPCLSFGKWGQGTVGNLLKNTALLGTVTIQGVTLERYYPAVITGEEWKQLQAKLADNKNRKGSNPVSDYVANLFRNRCKCSKCGGTMTTQHLFYSCKGKRVDACHAKGSVKIREIELDLFIFFLQESPEVFIGSQDKANNRQVAELKTRIANLDKTIADVSELIGTLPITELKGKLTVLQANRQNAKNELDQLGIRMVSNGNIPKSLDSIRKAVCPDPDNYFKTYTISEIAKVLNAQLANNEIRKQLLHLLPNLVSHLIIDLEKNSYAIVNHSGEKTWRQVWASNFRQEKVA